MEIEQSQVVILVTTLIFIEVILIICRRLVSPLNVIILYWYLWLFVSTLGVGGLYIPSVDIYLVHATFLLSFVIGGIVADERVKKLKYKNIVPVMQVVNVVITRKINNTMFKFFILLFPYTIYLFIQGVLLILGDYSGLRGSLVSMEDNPIFSSVLVNYFYYVVLNGLWTMYALFACVSFFIFNEKKHIVMIMIYTGLLSGIYFSRSYMYYFFVILAWSYLLQIFTRKQGVIKFITRILVGLLCNKKTRVLSIIFLIIVLGVQIQSVLRTESGGKKIENVFTHVLVKYHTAGFVLFDLELDDNLSSLNNNSTYGLGMIGGVERFVALCIKQLNKDYKPIVARDSLSKFQQVGVDSNGIKIRSNALYNIVYTLVRDGRYFALVFGGIVLGYISNVHFYIWKNSLSAYSYAISIFMFSLMTTSLIRSNLESTSYWICIALLFLLSKLYNSEMRKYKYIYPVTGNKALSESKIL